MELWQIDWSKCNSSIPIFEVSDYNAILYPIVYQHLAIQITKRFLTYYYCHQFDYIHESDISGA